MSAVAPINLAIRSYGTDHGPDRHDFAQLVLPISGTLAIDVGGRQAVLDPSRAAFVAPGASHSQASPYPNRSLIVDLDAASLDNEVGAALLRRPWLTLAPAAMRLVDYMRLTLADHRATATATGLWLPLLLDAVTCADPQPRSRLAAMLAAVEAAPEQPWTATTMAARAAISVSRLHALFRAELDTTPRAWLAELRLRCAREWLAQSNESIAALAVRAGYADQSALTRAMRRATGRTPAAWRRHACETGSKIR